MCSKQIKTDACVLVPPFPCRLPSRSLCLGLRVSVGLLVRSSWFDGETVSCRAETNWHRGARTLSSRVADSFVSFALLPVSDPWTF